MADQVDIMLAEYEMGEHAQRFIDSPIGQYVVRRCLDEIESFRNDLEIEQDETKIRELQREIAARRLSLGWIKQAIDQGHVAGQQLELTQTED
jgi:hypothetical protein